MQRFQDRVAVITGGSRGIGFAIAQRLVDEGASVVITGRRQESLDAAVAELGSRASALAGKADDAGHRAEVFAHIAERIGRLDHLVNNAGINPAYGPMLGSIRPRRRRSLPSTCWGRWSGHGMPSPQVSRAPS